ncbi:hypothetical protein KPL71_024225 [Citrus sinensis]|uniref:Uncharacterized protein n=1 Tax=Citrus sinensis TaxID=2711 RepID=A0ACB8IPY0_CITSI|nr:hypothetical protein KPL71_024225 [Citrus sinensis]
MSVLSMAILIYLDYKRAHERNPKRVLNLIIKLEGLWVKLGQYLCTRANVLPEAYISLLKQLQDSLPPRPVQEVSQTIERELGESMGDMFMDFVETPLATASQLLLNRKPTAQMLKNALVETAEEDHHMAGNPDLEGRMGTRMIGRQPLIFDHATQFFTVNDSRFGELVDG